jgi:hypothetical protein
MSDIDYTFEYLTISKKFVTDFDKYYSSHKKSILKQVIRNIETKYNIKVIKTDNIYGRTDS